MSERLAILISGGGSTMCEIIKAVNSGELSVDIACIISSNQNAKGIEKAKQLGIDEKYIFIIDPTTFKNKEGKTDRNLFGLKLLEKIQQCNATVITQNGWLPLTPEPVIEAFPSKIFNQHPGPVPYFGGKGMYGRRVHAARLLFVRMIKRDYWTQAIAQRVSINYDQGAVVKSEQIDILPADTVEDLQQRVLQAEHRVQIALLKDLATGKVLKEEAIIKNLVFPQEEEILQIAKRVAINLYPNG